MAIHIGRVRSDNGRSCALISRRGSLAAMALACGGFGLATASASGNPQLPDFPTRPITIVVPSAAGNVNDAVARLIGQELQAAWGQPVVVENRPGAGTLTGTKYVAGAPKDGHTLLLTFTAHVQNPSLFKSTGYDPIKDFTAVSEVALSAVILAAAPDFEAKTVADIVKLAKARPGEMTYGSYGVGTTGHILGELFKREAGLQLTHVAYKGGAPLANDLAAGHIKFGWIAAGTAMPLIKAGRLRPMAFAGVQRSDLMPEVPTMQELGYRGFEPDTWMGLLAPAGVPADRVNALSTQVARIVKRPEMVKRMHDMNLVPVGSTSGQFQTRMETDLQAWSRMIRELGITVE